MTLPQSGTQSRAKQKRLELDEMLGHLETCIRKKLPPLIILLSQGAKGEQGNLIRKDIAAIRALMKRINPEVMQWGSTADRMRYQNLLHNFDSQMRSAELRQQDKERRRFSRIDLDLAVTVSSPQASQRARAVNMNLDGLRLRSGALPRPGDTIELDLTELPAKPVKGKVIWSRDGEAGVKFLTLDDDTRECIRRYLNEEQERQSSTPAPAPAAPDRPEDEEA